MAASAKTLKPKTDPSLNENWTIVAPRRGKKKITCSYPKKAPPPATTEHPIPWAPSDSETDPLRELKLREKLQNSLKKLETSKFFLASLAQLESPEIMDRFKKALASEPAMKMVIYGLGSIESYESSRSQLSLALLLKKRLSWIGEVEVFDPILSATEARVLGSLGCSVLAVNEHGRRRAERPTVFFMPHCEVELYNNLLEENWSVGMLNNVVLFGNSFRGYEDVSRFKSESSAVASMAKHVLSVGKFVDEFKIETGSDDYSAIFNDSSWHFFSPDQETGLPFITT